MHIDHELPSLIFFQQSNETQQIDYTRTTTASDCDDGFELMRKCTASKFFALDYGVSSLYMAALVGMFVTAALLHTTEAFCLLHGFWYILCLPGSFIFLFIFSICNLESKSWGTREGNVPGRDGNKKKTTITEHIALFILRFKQVRLHFPVSGRVYVCAWVL